MSERPSKRFRLDDDDEEEFDVLESGSVGGHPTATYSAMMMTMVTPAATPSTPLSPSPSPTSDMEDDIHAYIDSLQQELGFVSQHGHSLIDGTIRQLTFAEAELGFREKKFVKHFKLYEITYPAPLSSGRNTTYIITGVTMTSAKVGRFETSMMLKKYSASLDLIEMEAATNNHPFFTLMMNTMPECLRRGGRPFQHFTSAFKVYCIRDVEELRGEIDAHHRRRFDINREHRDFLKEKKLLEQLGDEFCQDVMAIFNAPLLSTQ